MMFLLIAIVFVLVATVYVIKQILCQHRSLSNIDSDLGQLRIDQIRPFSVRFDWRTQPQTPYRPWHNGPYHVTMGLKKMDIVDWIEVDDTYLDKYALKKELFENNREDVLQVLPGCEEAAFEALYLLKDILVRRYPQMFRLQQPFVIENLVTNDIWDLRRDAFTWTKHHPLEVMSLLAIEDFFLLQNDTHTGETTLRVGAVCFPAGFKIEERIGHSLWKIHAGSVPDYESKLAKSMDKFFFNLKVGSAVQRFNYAIDDSGVLFHRHSHHNLGEAGSGKTPKLEDLHLRVERQTLQRLPQTRAILFTIRTYVTPITEVTKDLDVARALRTNFSSFSDDVAKYKNKSLWNDTMLQHIADVLGETHIEPIPSTSSPPAN